LMEAGFKAPAERFRPGTPFQTRLMESLAEFGQEPQLKAALKEVADHFESLRNQLLKRGVEPARVEDFVKRIGEQAFQRAAGSREARLGAKAYTSPRVTQAIFKLPDGTEKRVLSSDKTELAQYMKAAKAGEVEHVGTWDIAAEEWNALAREKGVKLAHPEFRGDMFRKNIPESVAASQGEFHRRMGAADIRDMALPWRTKMTEAQKTSDPLFQHLVPYESIPGIKGSPFHTYVGEQLKGFAYPQPIADAIQRVATISKDPENINRALRYTDATLSFWKTVTLMHPQYTVRNVFQNIFGMTYTGVNVPKAMVKMPGLKPFVRAVRKGRDVSGMTFTVQGRKVPGNVLLDSLKAVNALNSGMMSMIAAPTGFRRVKAALRTVGGKWFDINNDIENSMRIAGILSLVDEGMTLKQAAVKMTMAMPDMTDLTLFERNVMRRTFPFYSWMRKNASNVVKLTIEKPAILAGTEKLRRTAEMVLSGDKVVDPMLRPSWMEEEQALQILGDEKRGKMFLMASWLPFEEIMSMLGAAQEPGQFFNMLLSRLRPGAKYMIETGVGQDIFRKRPVGSLSTPEMLGDIPAALAGRSGTPLDNFLGIRPVREAVRIGKDMPDMEARALRLLGGGSLQPIDVQRAKLGKLRDLREKMQKVRNAINRARTVKDSAEAARLTKDWFRIQRQLLELGGPGVAKVTARSLKRMGVRAGEPMFAE
ncbi:MAG TPA: hypothetical protein VNA25_22215, partial [Phycisphaerae bacterium]|nr:hypothetical protein [Phycisphaerae bacterium]